VDAADGCPCGKGVYDAMYVEGVTFLGPRRAAKALLKLVEKKKIVD
jgi:hypothetical protein